MDQPTYERLCRNIRNAQGSVSLANDILAIESGSLDPRFALATELTRNIETLLAGLSTELEKLNPAA